VVGLTERGHLIISLVIGGFPLSNIINWINKPTGPASIVLYTEFYDHSLSDHIHILPEGKEEVLMAIVGMLNELDQPATEDISIHITATNGTKRNKGGDLINDTWDYAYLMDNGMEKIIEEVQAKLASVWDLRWSLECWHRDSNGNIEFNFRRHNFV